MSLSSLISTKVYIPDAAAFVPYASMRYPIDDSFHEKLLSEGANSLSRDGILTKTTNAPMPNGNPLAAITAQ